MWHVSDWQYRLEAKHTATKTDSELALNDVRETLTGHKTVDQSSSFSYVNTNSSLPANNDEVRVFRASLNFRLLFLEYFFFNTNLLREDVVLA